MARTRKEREIEIRPLNVDNHAIAIYVQSMYFHSLPPPSPEECSNKRCTFVRKTDEAICVYIYIYTRRSRRCIISNVSASKAYYYFLVP